MRASPYQSSECPQSLLSAPRYSIIKMKLLRGCLAYVTARARNEETEGKTREKGTARAEEGKEAGKESKKPAAGHPQGRPDQPGCARKPPESPDEQGRKVPLPRGHRHAPQDAPGPED